MLTKTPVSTEASRQQPPAVQFASGASDEVTKVLAVHGREAGQFSVLGPDPWQVVWSDERDGFVPFLEGRGCLLSWRSPVAPVESQGAIVARLVEHARDVGKPLIAVAVNEAVRDVGAQLGLVPMWIGTEGVIDLPSWSIRGGRRQKIRWARSHAERLGHSWREAYPLTDARDVADLERVEHQWKTERPERFTDSFLRTSFLELAELRRYFVCDGPTGVVASVTCTPVNESDWYLQDIVRTPDAPRGALEGALACALDALRDDGYAFASNGPMPFWRPHERWSDPHQLGAIGNQVVRYMDRRYRFRGISQFRAKLDPDRIVPVYVVRTHRFVTPRVALSLTRLLNDSVEARGPATDAAQSTREK